MGRELLLLHSPLLGPSSLSRLADAAAVLGHRAVVPDLTAVARSGRPHATYRQLAAAAGAATGGNVVVVGHSGAGAFLPSIGAAIGDGAALLFVDAVVPPTAGAHRTPVHLVGLLDLHTSDGVLDRWLDWWPPDVVEELLPSPADRSEIVIDMPRLPRSFYDVAVAVPEGWSDGPCGYLRLSAAYDAELTLATARGWPGVALDSTHLGVFAEPERVLADLLALADRIDPVQ